MLGPCLLNFNVSYKSPWEFCLMADSDSGSLGRDLRVCVSNKLPCIASIGLWAIYFEEQGLRGLLVNLYSCLPKPRNTGIFVFLKPLYSEELFFYICTEQLYARQRPTF